MVFRVVLAETGIYTNSISATVNQKPRTELSELLLLLLRSKILACEDFIRAKISLLSQKSQKVFKKNKK